MAAKSILNGEYAEAYVGGVLLALLTDWEVHLQTDKLDITGHADLWRYSVPVVTGWTFRAKGYIVPGALPQYLHSLWRTGGAINYFSIAGYQTDSSSTKLFEGTGLPVEGSLSAPMELATQEFTLEGYGPPTTGLS